MKRSQKDKILQYSKKIEWILLYLSLIASIGILFHIGYSVDYYTDTFFQNSLSILFYVFTALLFLRAIIRFIIERDLMSNKLYYSDLLLCAYFVIVIINRNFYVTDLSIGDKWLYIGFFGVFLVEISKNVLFFDRFYFNPMLLFAISFLLIIFLCTILLLSPEIMKEGSLSLVDALFMSTSAVCITGLSVVDVSSEFTNFGQIVLITLVQLGGLGMMTFTGFFGYFFSGGFSYKNQIMYTELLGENKLGGVISSLLKIILITFTFEAIGALLIYVNTSEALFNSLGEHIFFSIFHGISAFCNAGFSNISDGLLNEDLQFNYNIQLVIAVLFILGGLGFNIISNVYAFVIRWIINIFNRIRYGTPFIYRAWVINFNSRLIAWTTFCLLVFGTIATFIFEYDHTLSNHSSFWGKLVAAFFMGASPRTAGFNSVDMTALSFPTVIIIIMLMWIGASPGSTGGGIKTTTFALAILNLASLIRGKERAEVFGREISWNSTRRAFAIIILSLITISISILSLSLTDGSQGLKNLAFESFSAFGTVGLSLGITTEISDAGRVILTFTMFIGRIGTLTLLLALFNRKKVKNYQYPIEKVLL